MQKCAKRQEPVQGQPGVELEENLGKNSRQEEKESRTRDAGTTLTHARREQSRQAAEEAADQERTEDGQKSTAQIFIEKFGVSWGGPDTDPGWEYLLPREQQSQRRARSKVTQVEVK